MDNIANTYVFRIMISYSNILLYNIINLFFKLAYAEVGLFIGEGENEAVLDIIVSATRKILRWHTVFTKILCGMRHKTVCKGVVNYLFNFIGLGTE